MLLPVTRSAASKGRIQGCCFPDVVNKGIIKLTNIREEAARLKAIRHVSAAGTPG